MLGSRCDGGCCEVTKPILMRLLVAAVIACGAHEARAQSAMAIARRRPPPPRPGPHSTPFPFGFGQRHGLCRHRSHRRHRRPGHLELLQPASAASPPPPPPPGPIRRTGWLRRSSNCTGVAVLVVGGRWWSGGGGRRWCRGRRGASLRAHRSALRSTCNLPPAGVTSFVDNIASSRHSVDRVGASARRYRGAPQHDAAANELPFASPGGRCTSGASTTAPLSPI